MKLAMPSRPHQVVPVRPLGPYRAPGSRDPLGAIASTHWGRVRPVYDRGVLEKVVDGVLFLLGLGDVGEDRPEPRCVRPRIDVHEHGLRVDLGRGVRDVLWSDLVAVGPGWESLERCDGTRLELPPELAEALAREPIAIDVPPDTA